MKKGLILEGGAMRGMFTAGVLDVLMESGIEFDGGIGVSAGACFGVNYKSKQIGRAIRYNTRFCSDKRYCGIGCLIKDGNIYSKDFCYHDVPIEHDPFDFETYRANPMEFYVVATDVDTGKAVYHKFEGTEENFEWIRASASMPVVSEMVEIDGQKFLDGALADSIPVQFFEGLGYDRNIVVLTQPKNYIRKKDQAFPIMKRMYRKYPKLLKSIENRHIKYNQTIAYISQMERAGKLLVIRPDRELPVSRVEKDPEKLMEAYQIGRRIAAERLEEIRNYLNR